MVPTDGNRDRRWRLAAIVLAFSAAAIAGYLGVVSFQLRGTPWGCGDGSGCANVLKSRWSNVAGVPVGFLAVVAYLLLATLVWRSHLPTGIRSSRLLTVVASAVLSSAVYFALLQLIVIQSVCPWCMLDHAMGGSAALASLVIARRQTPRRTSGEVRSTTSLDPFAQSDAPRAMPAPVTVGRRRSAMGDISAGVTLTLLFVALQHFTARTPDVARIESNIDDDGSRGTLSLSLPGGKVTLALSHLPYLGLETAPRRLLLMFDYCCPHCREAHAVIRRIQPLGQAEWQVLCVPTPLNRDCNPAIEETEPRFQDACELARLSLAVWRLRPADWPAFDAWLFEPESPRSASEARNYAGALYGELEVAEALADPAVDRAIASNVAVYQASGGKVLPLILSPGTAGVAGRTDGEDELRTLLAREFGFPTPPQP